MGIDPTSSTAFMTQSYYVRSVKTIGPLYYSSLQVEAWLSLRPSPERLHQLSADGRTRLVAVDDSDQPIAFADLENDGHIAFLYCSPEVAGTGVASALYNELERIARDRGIIRLHSEVSEAARRLFLRKGFVVTARRQFEISGVPIHNYAVEKVLGKEETECVRRFKR
jgi:putative acetyltransferase